MADLVTALGLLLVIEGIIYGAFPQLGRRIGEFLRGASDDMLRTAGLASAAIGVLVVWLARSAM